MTDRPAAPTSTSTPSRPTARPTSRASSSTWRPVASSTSSPSPTTNASTPRWRPRPWPRDRGLALEVVVGEEVTTLGGHLLALWIDRPIRPYRSLRTTIKAVHAAGGLAIPAHPLVPYPLCAQGWVLRSLLDDGDETVHPDGLETFNPTALGRPWHDRVVRFADEHGAGPGGQQRRPRPRRDRRRLDDVRGAHGAPSCARRSSGAPPTTAAPSTARRARWRSSAGSSPSGRVTPVTRWSGGSVATGPAATTATLAVGRDRPATTRRTRRR